MFTLAVIAPREQHLLIEDEQKSRFFFGAAQTSLNVDQQERSNGGVALFIAVILRANQLAIVCRTRGGNKYWSIFCFKWKLQK